MRLFWLTARIAVLFALLMTLLLAASLHLFSRIMGGEVMQEIDIARTREAVLVAKKLEELCPEGRFDNPACRDFLRSIENEEGTWLAVLDPTGRVLAGRLGHALPKHLPWRTVEIEGRTCQIGGPPGLLARVPVLAQGRTVATLETARRYHSRESHQAFLHGLLAIGLTGLVGIVLLSLYLTRPIRRMSRSMDRIASGDLEHRVNAGGRDEVAAMGQSFNAMADQVQEMVRGQKELLAGVSHELRSPLARMKMSLELLREGGAPRERLEDLESDVDAVDSLVEELLVASRLDFDAAPIEPREIPLDALARQAWARIAEEADRAGMALEVRIADDARTIVIDPALGVRVLGNLFENAVRHAGRGAVVLASRRVAGDVEVSVDDEGPGVPEAHLTRIFEPFYRVDPSRSRKTGSVGLGLGIVKRAVEAHGGRVRAERGARGGLAVSFRLPFARQA